MRVVISDPSYVFEGFDYDKEVCVDWAMYKEAIGGLGMLVSSGFGDGNYPVEVKVEDCGIWGDRVTELRIRFVPHEAFDDEEGDDEGA